MTEFLILEFLITEFLIPYQPDRELEEIAAQRREEPVGEVVHAEPQFPVAAVAEGEQAAGV